MGDEGDPQFGLATMENSFHESDRRTAVRRDHERSRIGLLPTDGDGAYKRSAARSSRRSRAERTSYLMATGHIDPEETRQLNSSAIETNESYSEPRIPVKFENQQKGNPTRDHNRASRNDRRNEQSISVRAPMLDLNLSDDIRHEDNHGQSPMRGLQFGEIFIQPIEPKNGGKKPKIFNSNNNKLSPYSNQSTNRYGPTHSMDNSNDDAPNSRGKFRQTYTEVSLPMKTSPAFEYILKDNRRRNKRCCMWLLYSTLVTICIAIIAFSSVHLLLRYGDFI